jgi:hypothetical protein
MEESRECAAPKEGLPVPTLALWRRNYGRISFGCYGVSDRNHLHVDHFAVRIRFEIG